MPQPFLSLLPATARAAYPFVLAGVRRGLSSRDIERIVRRAGLKISRPRSIVPMMSKLRTLEAQGGAVRFIPKTRTIDVSRLPESLTPIRRAFSYIVRVRGRDEFAQIVDRLVTVTTDRKLMTPGEIEEVAESYQADREHYETLSEVKVTLQSGMRRGEFAT